MQVVVKVALTDWDPLHRWPPHRRVAERCICSAVPSAAGQAPPGRNPFAPFWSFLCLPATRTTRRDAPLNYNNQSTTTMTTASEARGATCLRNLPQPQSSPTPSSLLFSSLLSFLAYETVSPPTRLKVSTRKGSESIFQLPPLWPFARLSTPHHTTPHSPTATVIR